MRECGEYEITIGKLLKVVHSFTEKVQIEIVGAPKRQWYTLTIDAVKDEKRMEKYYSQVPVWNITADIDNGWKYGKGNKSFVPVIVARCHWEDIGLMVLTEHDDIKKERKRQRRKEKKEG